MTATTRRTAREIGSDGMMMNYSNPHIIKHQLVALKNLDLLAEAMPSIEAHNPVLAAAIASGREHYLHYDSMHEEVKDYRYEGSNGEGFIGQTKTWVAHLHYELQTVALFDLVRSLEADELKPGSIADYRTALGNTPHSDDGDLAFNFNPDRQPDGFFDGVAATMFKDARKPQRRNGMEIQYLVPDFLWSELTRVERGRLAAKLIRADLNGEFNEHALKRSMGKSSLVSSRGTPSSMTPQSWRMSSRASSTNGASTSLKAVWCSMTRDSRGAKSFAAWLLAARPTDGLHYCSRRCTVLPQHTTPT